MALRIKSHWHDDDRERSLQEIGGAIAFIAWRIAKDKAITLHGEDFVYRGDEQRMGVIQEYLIFLVQIADRLAYRMLDEEARKRLITRLALDLAGHVQDNSLDLFGPADYGRPFLEKLNARAAEYADFTVDAEGPSYPFLRHLGYEIQRIMGEREQNRWIIDQVMDKDGWDAYNKFQRAMRDLFE